jgi:hypothetical protein
MDDPAKRQYFMFSFVLGVIIGLFLNFFLADLITGPIVSGFPFNVSDASGIGGFFQKIINSTVMGALLTVPIYYGITWLQNRGGGGSY